MAVPRGFGAMDEDPDRRRLPYKQEALLSGRASAVNDPWVKP